MDSIPNQDEAGTQDDSSSEMKLNQKLLLNHLKLFQACLYHI